MKLFLNRPNRLGKISSWQLAFTLTELMVTSSITAMVVLGVVSAHIYGLKMCEFVKPRLGVSDDARRALSKLTDDVRSAKVVKIGKGGLTGFTNIAINTPQSGTALQITNAAGKWIRYYYANGALMRTTNGTRGDAVVTHTITNSAIFTAENYAGVTATNELAYPVIGVMLKFSKIEYPITRIGPGETYNYYQLRAKIFPRTN